MRGQVPTREQSALGDCADQLEVDAFRGDINWHLQVIDQSIMQRVLIEIEYLDRIALNNFQISRNDVDVRTVMLGES